MIDEKEMSEGNNGRVAQAEEITRILRMLDEERRNCKMNSLNSLGARRSTARSLRVGF